MLYKVYNKQGIAKHKLGQYREAIADYNKAIKINPKYAEAYNNRGLTYRQIGNEVKALKDFKKASELDPTIIVKESPEVTEIDKKTKETQNFQGILEEQKKDLEKDKKISYQTLWWCISTTLAIIITSIVSIYFVENFKFPYPLSVFSVSVTVFFANRYARSRQAYFESKQSFSCSKNV